MKKPCNKFIVLLLCFFSLSASTFQDDYEGDSILSVGINNVDKTVASRPYGYCLKERMSIELCKMVSIPLTSQTHFDYSLGRIPRPTKKTDIPGIIANFSLGIDNAIYDVPTPGQLRSLRNQGLVTNTPKQCFWAKMVTDGVVDYVELSDDTFQCNSPNGTLLTRLVTAEFPSACPPSDTICGFLTRTDYIFTLTINQIHEHHNGFLEMGFKISSNRGVERIVFNVPGKKIIKVPIEGTSNLFVEFFINNTQVLTRQSNLENRNASGSKATCFAMSGTLRGHSWGQFNYSDARCVPE